MLFDASSSVWLAVNASNVTITNSVIRPGSDGSVRVFGTNVVLQDCTMTPAGADPFTTESAVSGSNYSLTRCKILSGADGVFVDGTNIVV